MPKKIPHGALRLVQIGEGCHAFADGDEKKKKLKMTVYSGGIIKNHWWWGDLVVDLTGMKFDRKKYPVLENHDTSKKIGFTGKPIVDGAITLDPDKTEFVSTEESEQFQQTSSEGFPYQASMYTIPTKVERIEKDSKAEVNGFTLKGPATVWREAVFQEASVCVFGWDKQTESSAFSKEQTTELEYEEIGGDAEIFTLKSGFDKIDKNKEEVKEMPKTVKELQEKYPDLTTKLTDQITDELSTIHSQDLEAKEAEITKLKNENEKKVDRIDQLEKKDIIRTEKEINSEARQIVNSKLAATDIPERLYDKIRRLVKHNKFVKDDVLDTEAFAKFVDEEIKDFEDAGVTKTVLGLGRTHREEGDNDDPEKKLDKEDDEAADKMYKMVAGESDE